MAAPWRYSLEFAAVAGVASVVRALPRPVSEGFQDIGAIGLGHRRRMHHLGLINNPDNICRIAHTKTCHEILPSPLSGRGVHRFG